MVSNFQAARRLAVISSAAALAFVLSGCAMMHPGLTTQRLGAGEVPTPLGPPVRDNRSPMEAALACFGDQLAASGAPHRVIAVGDVKDYTGKYSINEGNAITQGGALMVYSALGKIGDTLTIAERFDPSVAERELAYTDRRQLGDGSVHEVNGNRVPWLPYFGGTIAQSDYYIVGGITELNYDIDSGGGEFQVNNVGPKARVFSQSVAVDLRIVDSRSLVVMKTVSLTKQFSGYEIGANLFRFFGTSLFDINIGAKGQEPLQLGIRTALEEATMRLIAAVARQDPSTCMTRRLVTVPDQTADELRSHGSGQPAGKGTPAATMRSADGANGQAGSVSLNAAADRPGGTGPAGKPGDGGFQITFEFGDTMLTGAAQAVLDRIAQSAGATPIEVTITARDTENWDPAKRDALLDQRIAAVMSALASRGIAPAAIGIIWRPDKADTGIHRDGPGLQDIARIQVRK